MNREHDVVNKARLAACYHEAGHAVAAYHQGWDVVEVIATDEVWWTHYRRPAFGGSDHWRAACVTLAGWYADMQFGWGEIRTDSWWEFLHKALAERYYAEEEGFEYLLGDSSQLLDQLEDMSAEWLYDSNREACYWETVKETKELVLEYWHEIEAVARALEASPEGTLGGTQVVQIIEAVGREASSSEEGR